MNFFKMLFLSLRPRQWLKNLILFAALIFSKNLFQPDLFIKVTFAFIIFCFLSGAIYLVNDLVDLEKDKKHPEKKKRPIASGRLSEKGAKFASLIIPVLCLVSAWQLGESFFLISCCYLLLMLSYSLFIKQWVLLDVMAIALGFVLRAVAGAVVISVEASSWFLICTILLALFLGLAKRRHELVLLKEKASGHRKSLNQYSTALLDQLIAAVTSSTILAYALYTMGAETVARFGTKNLVYTLPFVIYGVFRYLYLMYVHEHGGNPEKVLLTDKPLILNIILYLGTVGFILYS